VICPSGQDVARCRGRFRCVDIRLRWRICRTQGVILALPAYAGCPCVCRRGILAACDYLTSGRAIGLPVNKQDDRSVARRCEGKLFSLVPAVKEAVVGSIGRQIRGVSRPRRQLGCLGLRRRRFRRIRRGCPLLSSAIPGASILLAAEPAIVENGLTGVNYFQNRFEPNPGFRSAIQPPSLMQWMRAALAATSLCAMSVL
jgi:hypothetical protein